MNLDQFIAWATGQSLLYNTADPSLRGQCVQLACFYVQKVLNKPVIWADAYPWFAGGAYSDQYERIPNDHNNPNQVPPRGALIVWGPELPGSAGAGHIAVAVDVQPGASTFVSFDSNWGGKTAHLVTHNWSYVAGWIIPKSGPVCAPAAPAGGSEEMIADTNQAHQAYKMLRPNGDGSDAEIAATAGKRTWADFASGAQSEMAARDANLRNQTAQLQQLNGTINAQNTTITDLTTKLNDATASNTEKQQALTTALAQLGDQNAQLTTLHDQLKQLQDAVPAATNGNTQNFTASWFVKLLAVFIKPNKQ